MKQTRQQSACEMALAQKAQKPEQKQECRKTSLYLTNKDDNDDVFVVDVGEFDLNTVLCFGSSLRSSRGECTVSKTKEQLYLWTVLPDPIIMDNRIIFGEQSAVPTGFNDMICELNSKGDLQQARECLASLFGTNGKVRWISAYCDEVVRSCFSKVAKMVRKDWNTKSFMKVMVD